MTNDHGGASVSHRARDIALIALISLAIAGIAVMDFTTEYGFWYWLVMVPVFGCVGVYLAARAHHADPDRRPLLLRRQILHWAVAIVGILITFLMLDAGTIERSAAGLVALLVLTLSTIMAGVHFEWRLAILGVVLGLTLVLAILAEHFFWLLLPLAVVAIVLLWRRRADD
jgi:hypothetical protein